jgi:hypothetical protein
VFNPFTTITPDPVLEVAVVTTIPGGVLTAEKEVYGNIELFGPAV